MNCIINIITINTAFTAYRRNSSYDRDMERLIHSYVRKTKRVMEFRYDHQIMISDEVTPEEKYKIVDLPTNINYTYASNAITKIESPRIYTLALI